MNRLLSTALLLALVLAASASTADRMRSWRLGASYAGYGNCETRERLGDAWGLTGEYSFANALDEGMDALPGDVSVCITYRRYNSDYLGVEFTSNYSSFGLKWRAGPGARPSCEGYYGGINLAAAIVQIWPSMDILSDSQSVVKFEYSVFGGANFADRYYAEVGYTRIPDISNYGFGSLLFTMGIRF